MLYKVARRAGLTEADAQDVVQERVAPTLGMNIAQVYLARHRISHAVKAAAQQITEERLHGVTPGVLHASRAAIPTSSNGNETQFHQRIIWQKNQALALASALLNRLSATRSAA